MTDTASRTSAGWPTHRMNNLAPSAGRSDRTRPLNRGSQHRDRLFRDREFRPDALHLRYKRQSGTSSSARASGAVVVHPIVSIGDHTE